MMLIHFRNSQALGNYPTDLSVRYKKMATAIKSGENFSDALKTADLKIPPYIYHLARAGELVGDLSGSLRNGLDQFEYDIEVAKGYSLAGEQNIV